MHSHYNDLGDLRKIHSTSPGVCEVLDAMTRLTLVRTAASLGIPVQSRLSCEPSVAQV